MHATLHRKDPVVCSRVFLLTLALSFVCAQSFAAVSYRGYAVDKWTGVVMFVAFTLIETVVANRFVTMRFGLVIGPILLANAVSILPWAIMGIDELGLGSWFWVGAHYHIFPVMLRFMPPAQVLVVFMVICFLFGMILEVLILRWFWREESRRDFLLAVVWANGVTLILLVAALLLKPGLILRETVYGLPG